MFVAAVVMSNDTVDECPCCAARWIAWKPTGRYDCFCVTSEEFPVLFCVTAPLPFFLLSSAPLSSLSSSLFCRRLSVRVVREEDEEEEEEAVRRGRAFGGRITAVPMREEEGRGEEEEEEEEDDDDDDEGDEDGTVLSLLRDCFCECAWMVCVYSDGFKISFTVGGSHILFSTSAFVFVCVGSISSNGDLPSLAVANESGI